MLHPVFPFPQLSHARNAQGPEPLVRSDQFYRFIILEFSCLGLNQFPPALDFGQTSVSDAD